MLLVDAAFTVSLRLAVAVCIVESVTVRTNVAVPAALAAGVPVRTPVEPLIVRPLGSPAAVKI